MRKWKGYVSAYSIIKDEITAAQQVLGALKWVYLPRKREGESSVGLTCQWKKGGAIKDFAACDLDHITVNLTEAVAVGTLLELDQNIFLSLRTELFFHQLSMNTDPKQVYTYRTDLQLQGLRKWEINLQDGDKLGGGSRIVIVVIACLTSYRCLRLVHIIRGSRVLDHIRYDFARRGKVDIVDRFGPYAIAALLLLHRQNE